MQRSFFGVWRGEVQGVKIRRTESGSQRLHFEAEEIEGMCMEALRESKCLPAAPEAVDIDFFIEKHFGVQLDVATDVGEGVLGYTVFSSLGNPLLVGVTPSLYENDDIVMRRRGRATLAHEAGHCLMHPILFMEDQGILKGVDNAVSDRILCRKSDINPAGGYQGRWWEWQANQAIGGLLLPKPLAIEAAEPFLDSRGGIGAAKSRSEAALALSETFDVNPVVAEIRLEGLFPVPA